MKNRILAFCLALLTVSLSFSVGVFAETEDPIDIFCVGESITCGSGANAAGTITEVKKDKDGSPVLDDDGNPVMVNSKIDVTLTYPVRLQAKVQYGQNTVYKVYNMGISGVALLPDPAYTWAQKGYLTAAKSSSTANPFKTTAGSPTADYIVVMLGTNDAKYRVWHAEKGTGGAENFYQYYTEMIEAFKAISTNPQIICVNPPPVINEIGVNDYNISERVLRMVIAPIIEQVAREQQCMYLDLREVFPDARYETEALKALYAVDDGVHPNKDGYNLIADSLVEYIKRKSGDANGSGNTTSDDLAYLAKYLAGWDEECVPLNCDVNLDGEVNVTDLSILAQYFSGWDVTLL